MSPLTRLLEIGICYFLTLPNELLLIVSKKLSFKDRLALADTCSVCRPLISEEDCIRACMHAGLSMIPGASKKALAKLLCRPRVGVCNWSLNSESDGGVPKGMFHCIAVTVVILKFSTYPSL